MRGRVRRLHPSGFSGLRLPDEDFSSIGGDGIGAGLLDEMNRSGIDSSLLHIHREERTAIAVYWLMYGNKKRPLAYYMSSFPPWPKTWDSGVLDELLDADLLHCGGYLHYPEMYFGNTAQLYRAAKERGVATSVDTQFTLDPERTKTPWLLNMTDILPYVDVLIADEEESLALAGAADPDGAARALLGEDMKVLIIKSGKNGSRVYTHDGIFFQEAVSVGETVDTIGAGDAYGAAFLTYYIEGADIPACARFASVCAGYTVTRAGGIAGMPERAEAERFIRNSFAG